MSGPTQETIAAAEASHAKWGILASITLAQFAVESGWGHFMPAGSNNPFGIKAGRGQPSVTARTREETASGHSYYINAAFRKYASMAEAFDEHARLLATNLRYHAVLTAKSPDAAAVALQAAGYATAGNYATALMSIIHSFNLGQYDRAVPVPHPMPPARQDETGRKYGWLRDAPDKRDLKFGLSAGAPTATPTADLRASFPPVIDQGTTNACTGAASAAVLWTLAQKGAAPFSALFPYYCARAVEGSIGSDIGCMPRDVIRELAKRGAPAETSWPLHPDILSVQPPLGVWEEAAQHLITKYERLDQTTAEMKRCLAVAKQPFLFGISVYTSFEAITTAQSGMVPMPDFTKESRLGGHYLVACGYDDAKEAILFRNSYGPTWGIGGYGWLPYAYITDADLAADFWVISALKG